MQSELMGILEQIERDKGIAKEVLIQAVEIAVASAARKIWTVSEDEEVSATLNPKTGKITAFANGEEIRSNEFGRIAAQTAKQVIFQKIREAEKDVVYNEYSLRVGSIISGSVYRFDRGNVIVDLGKTEAIIPRTELCGKEELKQGDRIRAMILEVQKEARGPQIVLSRAHPNFVKRLFELEVPEIYENIIEIKAIARDPGERTKISVYSKDEKVDSVGACVGMRGSRVKNIVNELHGEKIDIVRYATDIKEYIQAALSPAEISQMQVLPDEKKANIIVADDQLSIAIGRYGQNVRLASKLVGWELDIFSAKQWEESIRQQSGETLEENDDEPNQGDDLDQEESDVEETQDTEVSQETQEIELSQEAQATEENQETQVIEENQETPDTESAEVAEENPESSQDPS